MESMEVITKARLSGRGAVPILGFGKPKEVGSGSGIEDQLIPFDYGCMPLCLACVCCVHTLNVIRRGMSCTVYLRWGGKFSLMDHAWREPLTSDLRDGANMCCAVVFALVRAFVRCIREHCLTREISFHSLLYSPARVRF